MRCYADFARTRKKRRKVTAFFWKCQIFYEKKLMAWCRFDFCRFDFSFVRTCKGIGIYRICIVYQPYIYRVFVVIYGDREEIGKR